MNEGGTIQSPIQFVQMQGYINYSLFCHLDASVSGNSQFDRVYGPGTNSQRETKLHGKQKPDTVTVNEYKDVTTLLNIK